LSGVSSERGVVAVWRTQLGERVLRGAEWELFREGVSVLWDMVETSPEDDPYETGVEPFDRLQRNQKLAMLASVGRALRDEEVPPPELTALTEGTVAAVFRHILDLTLSEIEVADEPDPDGLDPEVSAQLPSWRALIVGACRAALKPEAKKSRKPQAVDDEGAFESWWEGPLPDESSEDVEKWELVVEWLSSRVLWDDGDYEREGDFLDADPETSGARKALLGIDEGYFADVAPDPTDSQLEAIRQTLRDVCERA
jgi:hypothetical protein